jgi:hypothetical protein
MSGANYRVTIDGITRVNHDLRETAIEMGKYAKSKNRNGDVKVRKIKDDSLVADIVADKSGVITAKLPN